GFSRCDCSYSSSEATLRRILLSSPSPALGNCARRAPDASASPLITTPLEPRYWCQCTRRSVVHFHPYQRGRRSLVCLTVPLFHKSLQVLARRACSALH